MNFFLKWNFFEMLCSRWIWIFEHVCFFDKLFRHQIFFSLWIVRSNFIIFFLSFENVIWKITLFEFFFSIDMKMWCYKSKTHFWWCCYVIFNKWKSNMNAIKHQIWKMMLNKYHIYVMKNDSIKKFFVIQKKHKIFILFIFFFRQLFFNQWFLII